MEKLKKEETVRESVVAATEGQPPANECKSIIPLKEEEINTVDFPDLWGVSYASELDIKTMPEVMDMFFDANVPIVEGLLYPGTYLFVGAPKVGKSFMLLQLAYHVSIGTNLWGLKTYKCPVLYLALEDTYERLQQRMYRMFGDDMATDFYLAIKAGKIGEMLEQQIDNFVVKHPTTRLILIDTLAKVRNDENLGYSYANDYSVIEKLKLISDKHKICILLVHHTRKMSSEDPFDMISGTNALMGAADGAYIMQKSKRTDNSAVIDVSLRDQQDQKLYLTRNLNTLCWELTQIENELWKAPSEPLLDAIVEMLQGQKDKSWVGSATELVQILKSDIAINAISKKLNANANRLLNEYNVRYCYKRTMHERIITLRIEEENK